MPFRRLLAGASLALAAACGGASDPDAPEPLPAAGTVAGRPSILLITVDTLRRDHLSCYGYFRETSPVIDRLAAEGILFERALASMASTYPSHLSLLTGLYPHQHGRTSNKDGVKKPYRSVEGCESAAVVLRELGYDTAAFVSSTVLHARTGIGEGFDVFSCPKAAQKPLKAVKISDGFLEWLEGRDGERPFFVWLHYWDTHEPNNPPEPHLLQFPTTDALRERIAAAGIRADAVIEEFEEDERVVERFFEATPVRSGGRRARRERESATTYQVDEDAIADLWNRYDADLHYVDTQIGRVFDALRERGAWDDSVIVFSADHGQSLGENRSFGHGRISNVNTFVPLVMRLPEGVVAQPARHEALVSLVDVMPTVLRRLDPGGESGPLAAYLAQVEGEDLFSGRFRRPHALTQESTRFHRGGEREEAYALLSGPWKYVRRGEDAQLFDLAGAGEYVDVRTEHPDVELRLKSRLTMLLRRLPLAEGAATSDAGPADETEELLQNLDELGYGGDE